MTSEYENHPASVLTDTRRGYLTMGLMALSAVILSAATIVHVNRTTDSGVLTNVCNSVELAAVTLMPYMISAAVAAITAIGIVTMMPLVRTGRSLTVVQERLREMAAGDLASTLRVDSNSGPVRHLVRDLNQASQEVGRRVSKLKVMNRQQWDLLQAIRQSAVAGDCGSVLCHVDQMEKNWDKVAAVEAELFS